MSISVKISQLDDGGSVASTDQIPVARGSINTVKIPANQFVINGSNVGVGTGQLYFDRSTGAGTTLQFRSLSGADGLSVSNQGNTLVISASGQNPVRTSIIGNGTTRTFAIGGTTSVNPNNYRVDIDGVLQEPTADYSIVGSNIIFVDPPPNGGKVTVVSNNLVRAFDVVPSDGSVTPQKLSVGGITWNTSGNVGIGGITNPLTTLDVNGAGTFRAQGPGEGGQLTLMDSTGSGAWEIDNLGFGSNSLFRIFRDKGVNNVNAIVVNTLGNVGIGTFTPQESLHVQGNVRVGAATLTQPSGSAPMFACRAWVNFDGTRNATDTGASTNGANVLIRASGNVASVLRNSVGNYTITFTTAMPDEHYCATAGINSFVSTNAVGVKTSGTSASSCVLQTVSNGTHTDMANASLAVFR